MRNISIYPVSKKEITDCLITLAEETAAEIQCGDIRPLLLQLAAQIIEESDFKFYPINEIKDF